MNTLTPHCEKCVRRFRARLASPLETLPTDAFSSLVGYYNAIEMEMAEYFPAMQEKGQGFFCIRPFMAGLLTDRRADRQQLPAGDRMLEGTWDSAYERLEILKSAFGD